ncbi:hypothetical protein [Streptomyces sp. SCSIO ZS0520]|uniref:zinc finger domain-containing protein n=1 Tax=Streptomyces sp. SCSIO ZS0520 TaxID=2892996 RepID=UPI0021D9E890|nr:hypothetical protein [Streptomyces sp. SCSIO ZS0520]
MSTAADTKAVDRAEILAALDAWGQGGAPAVVEFVAFVAGLVRDSDDPRGVLDRVHRVIGQDEVRRLAAHHCLTVLTADGPNSGLLGGRALVCERLLIVPPGQHPADTLADLRAHLARLADVAEPARALPQIAIACATCGARPGDLCTSHSGTRPRRHNTHQTRTQEWTRVRAQLGQVTTP